MANSDDAILTNSNVSPTSSTVQTIYPNLLKKYSSFTYNISLQTTTTQNYNAMMLSTIPTFSPSLWTTILKSGGVGPVRAHRPPVAPTPNSTNTIDLTTAGTTYYFTRDLFIENLNFKTLLSNTQFSRSNNVVDIDFDIIEPYGMNFLEELFDFCFSPDGLNEHNLFEIPYMLIITFNGYKDDGSWELVSGATKYIPINILNITTKMNTTGAIYSIKAFPLSNLAYSEQNGRVRNGFSASGASLDDITEKIIVGLNLDQSNKTSQDTSNTNTTKLNYEYPDVYDIVYTKQNGVDIGSCELARQEDIALKDTPMGNPVSSDNQEINIDAAAQNIVSYQIFQQAISAGTAIQVDNGTVAFNAGSSISDCLLQLLINSTYVVNQVLDYRTKLTTLYQTLKSTNPVPTQQQITNAVNSLNGQLNWFKIQAQVLYGKYDNVRNTYSKNITYFIKPYTVFSSKTNTVPSSTPPDSQVVKEYEYIFTGKNTEITNFDIEFNTSYLTYAQNNIATKSLATGDNKPEQNLTNLAQIASAAGFQIQPTLFNSAITMVAAGSNQKQSSNTGEVGSAKSQAADIASSLYAPMELLQLNLSVMGDPDYIKQDEIFSPTLPSTDLSVIQKNLSGVKNGGILFDNGEVYVKLTFLIPQDYDLNTGLLIKPTITNSNLKRNIFSGLYRILMVENKFTNGQFTQNIQAVRANDPIILQKSTN